jgi:hypothetical protein
MAKKRKLTVGHPEDNADITAVINRKSADYIEGLVKDAQVRVSLCVVGVSACVSWVCAWVCQPVCRPWVGVGVIDCLWFCVCGLLLLPPGRAGGHHTHKVHQADVLRVRVCVCRPRARP